MDEIIKILKKFKDEITTFFPPCEMSEIRKIETKYNIQFPDDYVEFLLHTNGFLLMSNEILGIGNKKDDIENTYLRETKEIEIPMPINLIPFSPDGRGNYYCFDFNNKNEIVFWVSNYEYTSNDTPEVTNETFTEWIKEVIIDWTIEDNDEDEILKSNPDNDPPPTSPLLKSNTYRTFEGKDYTKEEWEKYEAEQWKKFKDKDNPE